MATTPDFLVIGHVTRDLLADGTYRLGGTALYASVTAARLGYRVAVYTAGGSELDLAPLYRAAAGVEVICRPAVATTTFSNRYAGGHRQQYLFDWARPLSVEDFPPAWRAAPRVLLGPVAQEVAPSWCELFPHAVLGACLQGWLRTWDGTGQVHFAPWMEAWDWLPRFTAAFLSVEDLGEHLDLAATYVARCPLFVLTAGSQGATLYRQGRPEAVLPFAAQEVDPTGAGDVFAAAFLLRYGGGTPPSEAARFAAAAAALSVQGPGVETIPNLQTVTELLASRP